MKDDKRDKVVLSDSNNDHTFHDELFRTVLLSGLKGARPEHLKDILGDDPKKAHAALKAHNDALHGRMRGNVDQLEAIHAGARSHRASGNNPTPTQNRDVDRSTREKDNRVRAAKKRVFDRATIDRVKKIFGEDNE